jgi:hypothetical protein
MTVDDQVQLGLLLGYGAALAVLVLALGAAIEWLLGPVSVDDAVLSEPQDELPSFTRPVATGQCVACRDHRLMADLEYMRGLGYVCADGCSRGRVA